VPFVFTQEVIILSDTVADSTNDAITQKQTSVIAFILSEIWLVEKNIVSNN
jgi:hypothetical protein